MMKYLLIAVMLVANVSHVAMARRIKKIGQQKSHVQQDLSDGTEGTQTSTATQVSDVAKELFQGNELAQGTPDKDWDGCKAWTKKRLSTGNRLPLPLRLVRHPKAVLSVH